MQTLNSLVSYTTWANRTWLDFIFRDAASDAWLTGMISHIYLAEQAWFQRIYDEEVYPGVFEMRTGPELIAMAKLHEDRYAQVLQGDLDRIIAYKRFNGEAYETPLGDILLHLITHGAHHRGQMATHASREKLAFPTTDFINYSRSCTT